MLRILGAVALVVALGASGWWFSRAPARGIADVAALRPVVAPAQPEPSPTVSADLRSVAGPDSGRAAAPIAEVGLRVVDGATWRVILPRAEFPEAYALLDRQLAVEAEIRARGE